MSKKILTIVVIALVLTGGFFWLNSYIYEEKQATATDDYKNAEYMFSGERVKLTDGVGGTENFMGGASKTVVRYFGNEAHTDLDGDGREDVVFLVTQEAGGSGTFFYLVGALNTERGYVGTQAVLIGDRISPQTTEVHDGLVVVNYADRAVGEPMTAEPSVGRSLRLLYDPEAMDFGEVVMDFEGEVMTK
jgi:hypothetical protein